MRRVLRCLPLIVIAAVFLCAPLAAAADPPGIKWISAKHLRGVDGKEIYDTYCAVCHGPTGRGNGPAARFLSVPIPDLSTMADRDGAFSLVHVKFHVTDRPLVDRVMPDWQRILSRNYGDQLGFTEIALHNLVKHMELMQVHTTSR